MSHPIIQTENLSRHFGELRAVDQLNLEIPPGTIFGFLGPNGAGKTTTIRLLLGLLEPTTGTARVLGADVRSQGAEIRARCGALLEDHGLYERLSAADNLEFYGRIWRIPTTDRQERIRELLTSFELWERRSEPAGEWSKGMKQKLALARTLLHRPKLVFLDEPTAGLDPLASTALHTYLQRLVEREGVSVFLNTHNLAEAEKICHQVGVIRHGRLLAVGALPDLRRQTGESVLQISGRGFSPQVLADLRRQSGVTRVELENGRMVINLVPDTDSAPLVSWLVSAGVQIEEVQRSQASLESVFLSLMENDNA